MSIRQDIVQELNANGLRLAVVDDPEPDWYQLLVRGQAQGNDDLIVVTANWLDPSPRTARFIHRLRGPFIEETEGWAQTEADEEGIRYRLTRITGGDADAEDAWEQYQRDRQDSQRTTEELQANIRMDLERQNV